MCSSQEKYYLLFYYFRKSLLNILSLLYQEAYLRPYSKIRQGSLFLHLLTDITEGSILDVTGSDILVCYLFFYWIVQFVIQNQKIAGPIVTSREFGPFVSSTAGIIKEECFTSKTVQDEDLILVDTNDAIDLRKTIVIGRSNLQIIQTSKKSIRKRRFI